jgi:sulfite exporter TauE/SafE
MTYHLGRLTAYATIGLVFGLVGKVSLWQDYSRKCQYLLGLR